MLDFESVYREHADAVFRFALYLTGNYAAAEDLTSESFVRLWTARDVRVGTVRAYLFAIVRNLYRQRIRGGREEVPLEPTVRDVGPDPEQSAEASDRHRWVVARLRELGEVDRSALLMRMQHEMSYEEIAAALELSVGAAKVRVHRATARLARRWLEETSGNQS